MSWKVVELFGGSLEWRVPERFVDISAVREVPDNQEVYVCQDTDESIIIEILEYEHLSPEAAANHYFMDLALFNDSLDTSILRKTTYKTHEVLEGKEITVSVAIGTQKVAKFHEADTTANDVEIFLAVMRLPDFNTDILITYNSPVKLNPGSSSAQAVNVMAFSDTTTIEEKLKLREGFFEDLLKSIKINDIKLFAGDTN